MKRIKKIKKNSSLHPIMTFCILILMVIIVSGILTLFDVTTSYSKITSNGTYIKELVSSENLFSLHGLKIIFSNAVSNFAAFTPLSMLIIVLIGIGIMDKTGFLDSLFYVLTKKSSKKGVTFVLSLLCILSSITGDLGYVIFIPLSALLFKYGKRHPKAGIICAFASLTCGSAINVFMSSVDTTLMGYTNMAASLFIKDYSSSIFAYFIIMGLATVICAFIVSSVTENIIIPKLGHYELMDQSEDYLSKREKKGLLISLFFGGIYLLVIFYNLIPYAPLGGSFVDYSQKYLIDKLFGYNSFFSQGYVFVVVLLFFIVGLIYGLITKKINNAKDVFDGLSFSLDKIGHVLVFIFFASTLIFVFKTSNIGTLITAFFARFISANSYNGIPLIIITFIASIISTIFLPSSVGKWSILSPSIVPSFMNAGLSPEFATLIFRAGESISYGLTPLMAYFVIYLAYMKHYSVKDDEGIFGDIKYIVPYSLCLLVMWIILILLFYVIGIPFGIGAYPGL